MHRPQFEVARIIDRFGQQYIEKCQHNSFMVRTLDALQKCRTSALGGHIDYCDCCGEQRISYNSCGNRHCPKCQGAKQALWVEDRMNDALNVRYFHIVFTVPEELNQICLLDSNLFYKNLFECVWSVLQQIVKYLGQYSHRVAINNHRIKNIS
ncbi:MAG: transposase zinc-binding domain-containing protein, partial [Bacteroidales bacterium]|nr:transposase zinc-binding domain-containing protein [Bacteroidales bacterium]